MCVYGNYNENNFKLKKFNENNVLKKDIFIVQFYALSASKPLSTIIQPILVLHFKNQSLCIPIKFQ